MVKIVMVIVNLDLRIARLNPHHPIRKICWTRCNPAEKSNKSNESVKERWLDFQVNNSLTGSFLFSFRKLFVSRGGLSDILCGLSRSPRSRRRLSLEAWPGR